MGMTQGQLGKVVWIPLVGWEIGYFFWGWVGDRFVQKVSDAKKFFILMALMSLPSLATTLITSPALVLALFFWATFVADGYVVLSLRVGSLMYPTEQTAMIAGIGSGSWSAVLVGVLHFYGLWMDRKWYGLIFVSMSLLPLLGTATWIWLSRPWRIK
jgi:MFS family permease